MGTLRRSWLLPALFSFRTHRPWTVLCDSSCLCSVPSMTPPFLPNPKPTILGRRHPFGPAPCYCHWLSCCSLGELCEPVFPPPHLCSHCSPSPCHDAVSWGLSNIFLHPPRPSQSGISMKPSLVSPTSPALGSWRTLSKHSDCVKVSLIFSLPSLSYLRASTVFLIFGLPHPMTLDAAMVYSRLVICGMVEEHFKSILSKNQ